MKVTGYARLVGVTACLWAASATALDTGARSQVVDAFAAHLEQRYVFADTGRALAAELRQQQAAGAFGALATPQALAEQLTAIAQRVTRDKHLTVVFDPNAATHEPLGTPLQRRQSNHGFERVQRLPGNIGYLDLRYFDDLPQALTLATASMTWLAHTDALIFDLRRNDGGEPATIRYLQSYLFDTPTLLNSLHYRDPTAPGGWRIVDYVTLAEVPGPRYASSKPIRVLTSARTFSGGEEFAYNLQTRGRARVIGEATGGGAHPGATFALGHGLHANVPTGRAVNPITGSNWEGRGVLPDHALPAEQALSHAQVELLQWIVARESDPARRTALERRAQALQAGAPAL